MPEDCQWVWSQSYGCDTSIIKRLSPKKPPTPGAVRTEKCRAKKSPEDKIFDQAVKRARERVKKGDLRSSRLFTTLTKGYKTSKTLRIDNKCVYLSPDGTLNLGFVVARKTRIKGEWVIVQRSAKVRSPKTPFVIEAIERIYTKPIK